VSVGKIAAYLGILNQKLSGDYFDDTTEKLNAK
jgi:hypothetical protein